MWDTTIVLIILLAAGGFLLRRFLRQAKSGEISCGCGDCAQSSACGSCAAGRILDHPDDQDERN